MGDEAKTIFWWRAVGEGTVALVAAATPERAMELVQWQDLTAARLTVLDAEALATGPGAAETSQHRGWEIEPVDACPAPAPAEGIYFTVILGREPGGTPHDPYEDPQPGDFDEELEQELRRKEHTLTYQGKVYVLPVMRGISLEDEPGEPGIEDWIRDWLSQFRPISQVSGGNARVRLTIELLDVDA